MNKLLVKKVEELTLYLIEQQKTIKQQEQKLKTQSAKEKQLEERLDHLEDEQENK